MMTAVLGEMVLHCLRTSRPSMGFIRMSVMRRSNFSRRMASSASSPLSAQRYVVAVLLEHDFEKLPHALFVIDDQNLLWLRLVVDS